MKGLLMSNDNTPADGSIDQAKDRLRQGERLWLPEAVDPDWSRYGKEPVDLEEVCTDATVCGTIVEKTMVVTDYDDLATGGKKLAPAVVIHLDPEYRTDGKSDYLRRTGYGRVDGDLFSVTRTGDWVGLTFTGIATPRDPGKKPYSGFRTAHVPLPATLETAELERRASEPAEEPVDEEDDEGDGTLAV